MFARSISSSMCARSKACATGCCNRDGESGPRSRDIARRNTPIDALARAGVAAGSRLGSPLCCSLFGACSLRSGLRGGRAIGCPLFGCFAGAFAFVAGGLVRGLRRVAESPHDAVSSSRPNDRVRPSAAVWRRRPICRTPSWSPENAVHAEPYFGEFGPRHRVLQEFRGHRALAVSRSSTGGEPSTTQRPFNARTRLPFRVDGNISLTCNSS